MSAVATLSAGALVVVAAWPGRPVGGHARARSGPSWGPCTIRVEAALVPWGLAAFAFAFGLLFSGPVLAVVGGGGALVGRQILDRVRARRRRAAVTAAVPDLVDLFLVSASAGQPVASSLGIVSSRAPGAVRPVVEAAADRFAHGLALSECLHGLGDDLGRSGVPLTDALRQAAVSGVPLVPLLEGVAAATRDERRRRAQEVARRLPVTMLIPLVACTLPAAVLLAVVPVLLVSVASLSP